MDVTPYLPTIVTVLLSVGGVYALIVSRLTRLETMIENLTAVTERHNSVIERTFVLETQMKNVFHQLDEIKELKNHE